MPSGFSPEQAAYDVITCTELIFPAFHFGGRPKLVLMDTSYGKGKLNAFTRNTAISARVAVFSGR